MGDEGYEAYVFDTDRRIFQVSVVEGIYKNGTPYYWTDQPWRDHIRINECISTNATLLESIRIDSRQGNNITRKYPDI
jgi:hypothetical protein